MSLFLFLTVVQALVAAALVGLVLIQRSEGGGLGIGGGGGFMTSRGTANVLTRATAILAGLFFCTSLILSILAGMNRAPTSILQGGANAPASGAPAAPADDLLRRLNQPPATPAAPAAPAGPSVPRSQ